MKKISVPVLLLCLTATAAFGQLSHDPENSRPTPNPLTPYPSSIPPGRGTSYPPSYGPPSTPPPGTTSPKPSLVPVPTDTPRKKIVPSQVVAGIQKFYEVAHGITAEFVQEATIKSLNKVQTSRGKVYFRKPGKMAWIYDEPTKQKIVSDGLWLWLYLPENKQVIKNRTDQAFLTDTPNNFLSGMGNISRDFMVNVQPQVYDDLNNILLEFVPRNPQYNWTKIFAAVRPVTYGGEILYQVVQTTLYDRFGNLNKITFHNLSMFTKDEAWRVNDTVFHFIPPAGVKIIEPPATMRPR